MTRSPPQGGEFTDSNIRSVAYMLASRNKLPEWARYDKNILILGDKGQYPVACELARNKKLPEEMITEDILKIERHDGWNVACILAEHNLLPEWAKYDKDILMLVYNNGNFVLHKLAERGALPLEMMTPELLRNKRLGYSVLDILVRHRHLNPEILELPWDRKTYVFEHVQEMEFQKTMDEEDLSYIETQFKQMQIKQARQRLAVQTDPEIQKMER